MDDRFTPTAPVPAPINTPLLQQLLTQGWRFDFFQCVWLLERYCRTGLAAGGRGPAGQESVRFRPHISLGFPPSDVRRITRCRKAEGDGDYYQVDVTFLGLYGVSTPLPPHYAVDMLRSVERHAAAKAAANEPRGAGLTDLAETPEGISPDRDFLDLFHHRLISLFYRSGMKYRYDRAYGQAERDAITGYLMWLVGYPPAYHDALDGVSPVRLLRYAGLLTQRPRSAVSLEGFLQDYWNGPEVQVRQCVGRWVTLTSSDMNRIGSGNCSLGRDLTVGAEVHDFSGAFKVTVGPVNWTTYLSFLPDGEAHRQTRSLVARYTVDPLECSLEVRLAAGEVPEMTLSSSGEAGRLGYTSWVRTDELGATSATFSLSARARVAQVGGGVVESVAVGAVR